MVKRVLQVTAPGQFDIVERPIDPPGEGQVAVEIEAVTTCPQWDMHLWRGEPMFPTLPLSYPITPGQPGHEMVGRVVEVGPGGGPLSVGDRVAAWQALAIDLHGTYGTHVTHYTERLLRIPEDAPAEAWCPLELAMCSSALLLDIAKHGFLPCRRVGICGLGSGGLVAAQVARALGAEQVIGFDPLESRRRLAQDLGWCEALDPDVCGDRMRRGENDALDVSIDCVGSRQAVDFLGDHTNDVLALLGVQREDYAFKTAYFGGPPLRLWGFPNHNRSAGEFAHNLVMEGKLDLAPLSTHKVPLSQYDRVVDLLFSREAVKVCILCDAAST